MPHIAVFVDEFGAFASGANREFSKTVYNVAAQLAMKARAAGIHLIIGAQTPSKHHIPTDVRDNITFKLLGKQGSMYGAIVAGGTKAAFDLPKIAGRFIVQDGADSYPCQLPFISDDEIDAGITTAMTWGKPTIDIPFVSDVLSGDISFYTPLASSKQIYTTDVFIKTCLNDLGGSINYRGAWEIAKSEYDVSLSQVQAIAEELKLSEMLEFEGATYQLVTQGRGKRLEKVEIMENKTSDIYPEGELAMNNEVEL